MGAELAQALRQALVAARDDVHAAQDGRALRREHREQDDDGGAQGTTLIHDWVYEGRAIHLTDLTRLGADVRLLDAHRLQVTGPTRWSGAEVSCPPALRPAVVILLAMLAAKGTSVLRGVDIIARGYEGLTERLRELGAQIETFRD